jgi:hypothetical protein
MLAQAKVVVNRHNCHNITKTYILEDQNMMALFIIAKSLTML